MKHTPVASSNIASIAHDGQTLEVAFNNGTVYDYDSVPQKVYEDFLQAESKGQYLAQNIKGKYAYRKVA